MNDERFDAAGRKKTVPTRSTEQEWFIAQSVSTRDEKEQVFRLRYDVYVGEQKKAYPEADHVKRLLFDELDPDADIIAVKTAEGGIVGTVRANWFDSAATHAHYSDVFGIENFLGIDRGCISVCSRLAASPEHRHIRVRELLFESIYEHGLDRDTRLCFATCAPILLRMFGKYGFREFAAPILDPVVGKLHRTLLVLDDVAHLERVRSPFLEIAEARRAGVEPRAWLTKIFNDCGIRHADR
ncbi:GNAT family N-acyltransferase [Rudaea sp.]|uniref:N-acyl amino acid synthase FeeM domain-containing protein n=1 Tax=Rudaea sp. TaxID=2136325 RepID=UPI003220873C